MIAWLDAHTPFPPASEAWGPDSDAPGLLAAGADLSTSRLREAYRRGIFPWFSDGQPILWWSPEPRMVLPVQAFHASHSLRKTIARFRRNPDCEIRIDSAFHQVIEACANTPRAGQHGTWIVQPMQKAYRLWHEQGAVHSFETWIDGRLVGGLYGVNIGRMFFGESMFAWQTDASKIALAALVCFCRAHGISVIDCQQKTAHLSSMGGHTWPRHLFEGHLKQVVDLDPPEQWIYDDSLWSYLTETS